MKRRRRHGHALRRRYGRSRAMTTEQVIASAAAHLGGAMRSSAELCLSDARHLHREGDDKYARQRALKSLAYSVGILSPVYQAASRGAQ